MPASAREIEASIRAATEAGFRDKLVARGQARSMIWRDGELPEDSPPFSNMLSYDLLSYSYSLLSKGLQLLEADGDVDAARSAFEHAAGSIEAVIAKGVDDGIRNFHRVIAGAAYHLGRFSARAYSLIHSGLKDSNLSLPEQCITLLILRDLNGLETLIHTWKLGRRATDDSLVALLEQISPDAEKENPTEEDEADKDIMEIAVLALTDNFITSIGIAMLAFARGEKQLLQEAIKKLDLGMEESGEFNLVIQWWCHRLTIHLLKGLWDSSFHAQLPLSLDGQSDTSWIKLRKLFVASLYRRSRAEIELWPSQLEATKRAFNPIDNMVVSLPTSAGKTRIAELCILACLAASKRVVFVTPLRALSAQTEVTLQRTFQPLGKTVSSLYGSIGISDIDENFLHNRDIIVATPEKLDFALRNEPSLLDNVGLIVLDEGHMIGLGEREVRYEAQIQRLLKRPDAENRRIICLSAILPTGDELEDFVNWITCDKPDGLVQKDWRPTRLRFGEVAWQSSHARLEIQVGEEKPFVSKFLIAGIPPIGRRKKPFPCDQRELCLAVAWRFVEDGQSVMIFCPQRRSVEPFAKAIVDLNARGALKSVLSQNENVLATALAIGGEWFGPDHVLLKCLKLGVAVHHGALPTPFRKEVERLLREGILKITISSPTLAQGLNLSATTLIFQSLTRNREVIESSEFRNVVGRAGRAYVDLEGLVLYPMFDDHAKRREQWKKLIANDAGREMESGLLRLLMTLLVRMRNKIAPKNLEQLLDYVLNSAQAWDFPVLTSETAEQKTLEERKWREYLTSLDTAILSLIGEQAADEAEIEAKIDAILASSLFQRRLAHKREEIQNILRQTLVARARYVWSKSTPIQRKGYFLSGVGLDTGHLLDKHADVLGNLLVNANSHILAKDYAEAIKTIIAFSKIIFEIQPFVPESLPNNWEGILGTWLEGKPVASFTANNQNEVLQFIEQGLVYRLPWGMEAVRVRGLAHQQRIGDFNMADFELGYAVAAVETGSMNHSASMLMRSGFNSRLSAIKAVEVTKAEFSSPQELRNWLNSEVIIELTENIAWPTPETHHLWMDFIQSFNSSKHSKWEILNQAVGVVWNDVQAPASGTALRIVENNKGNAFVLGSDYEPLGKLKLLINHDREGLLLATAQSDPRLVNLEYIGPIDLFPA